MEKEKYLKIIDVLADKLYMMDLEARSMKYANEKMEIRIKELEEKLKEANNEV